MLDGNIKFANLDKRQTVTIDNPSAIIAAAGIINTAKRGRNHDTYASRLRNTHQRTLEQSIGFYMLLAPRSEAPQEIQDAFPIGKNLGEWYGDRIILFESASPPQSGGEDTFTPITVSDMGLRMMKYLGIIKENEA